jgi:hypothetical protein
MSHIGIFPKGIKESKVKCGIICSPVQIMFITATDCINLRLIITLLIKPKTARILID